MGGLRKFMPITAVTFIVGWLAIAGVPPFAGFWSKDEILLFAWDKSGSALLGPRPGHRPAHRLLHEPPGVPGLLRRAPVGRPRAPTTAGEAEQSAEAAEADGREPAPTRHDGRRRPRPRRTAIHPHESPWTMTVPLVVLAVSPSSAALLNLPLHDARSSSSTGSSRWSRPARPTSTVATGDQGRCWPSSPPSARSSASPSPSPVYLRRRLDERPVEPGVLARRLVLRLVDQPPSWAGPAAWPSTAVAWFDRTSSTARSTASAACAHRRPRRLRRVQTGFVRTTPSASPSAPSSWSSSSPSGGQL